MSPFHSISICPICGGGLCGVRICGLPQQERQSLLQDDGANEKSDPDTPTAAVDHNTGPHGLVVCDECEAIWLEPDTKSEHQYADPENSKCPVCGDHLWDGNNHWANRAEVEFLGYTDKIDPALDFVAQDLDGPGSGHLNMGGDIA